MTGSNFSVFVAGGTGYLGLPLLRELLKRGHAVRALVRAGSETKLPPGCEAIQGNATDPSTYAGNIRPSHTFVQLVGVSHPNPRKAAEFQAIDRASALGAIEAAKQCGQNWLPRIHTPRKLAEFFDVVEAEPSLIGSRTGMLRAESPMSQPLPRTFSGLQKDFTRFDLRLIGSLQPDAQHLKKILADYSSEHQQRPQSVLMLIGPEGDFTPAELALARRHECQPITLGPIILRVETAAIYCLSVLSYELLM